MTDRRPNRRGFLVLTAAFVAAAAFPWARILRDLRFVAIPVEDRSPNAALGHRLRDGGFTSALANGETARAPVVIVGGGIAGLSAAWWLTRNGFDDYVLLELEEKVGGNSASDRNAVSAYPWGAHYLPIPNVESKWVREFLAEIGVIRGKDASGRPIFDEAMVCHDAVERLWIDGRFQEGIVPQAGLDEGERDELRRFFAEMKRFGAMKGSDGKPIFAIPIAEGSRDRFRAEGVADLDAMTMAEWMDREGYRSKPLRWYVNYACRDDFGGKTESVSAWAGIHYHSARRGFAANADPSAILTWPEGNGWLADRIRERIEGEIRTGVVATSLAETPEGVAIDTFDARAGTRGKLVAGSAILAVPRFVGDRLVPADARRGSPEMTYVPWLVANLTVRDLPGLEAEGRSAITAWDNVSYYSDSLGYVVATHQSATIARASVLTFYWPLTDLAPREARAAAAKRTPGEWREKILTDLARTHPDIHSLVERIDYRIWGHGMICPTPGFLSGESRKRLEESAGRIHFAHSDISGMSIFEEAQYRGIVAANRVLAGLGRKAANGEA